MPTAHLHGMIWIMSALVDLSDRPQPPTSLLHSYYSWDGLRVDEFLYEQILPAIACDDKQPRSVERPRVRHRCDENSAPIAERLDQDELPPIKGPRRPAFLAWG